jgi:tryptophan 2,3-dioxygenase
VVRTFEYKGPGNRLIEDLGESVLELETNLGWRQRHLRAPADGVFGNKPGGSIKPGVFHSLLIAGNK